MEKNSAIKIAVVSGRYPHTTLSSYENHKAYCDKWGYHYISCSWPGRKSSRFLNKVEYILEYMDLFDYIFWIDDDAFFINFELDITKYLPRQNSFVSFCSSPSQRKLKTYISSGQFFIRCNATGVKFLERVYESDLVAIKDWWFRTQHEVGYFTNGDQDAMVFLLLEEEEFGQYDLYQHTCFNSRIEEISGINEDILVLHFAGTTGTKEEGCQKAAKLLDRSENLLPIEYIDIYNFQIRLRGLSAARENIRKVFCKLNAGIKRLI